MIEPVELKSIIELNTKIHDEIAAITERDLDKYKNSCINIAESVALMFGEKCELLQLPIKDDKIGGMIIKRNNNHYCLINTSQPRAFQNFVYLHELYHLLHDTEEKFHIITNDIESAFDINERKANYYASLMLLNKDSLRNNYYYLTKEKKMDLKTTIYRLMILFKTTYKTLLIRLFEIECIENFDIFYDHFKNFDLGIAYKDFKEIGLDTSILEESNAVSIGNLDMHIKEAREKNTLLEDFLDINISQYKHIMEEIKTIQEFE